MQSLLSFYSPNFEMWIPQPASSLLLSGLIWLAWKLYRVLHQLEQFQCTSGNNKLWKFWTWQRPTHWCHLFLLKLCLRVQNCPSWPKHLGLYLSTWFAVKVRKPSRCGNKTRQRYQLPWLDSLRLLHSVVCSKSTLSPLDRSLYTQWSLQLCSRCTSRSLVTGKWPQILSPWI